MNSADRQPPPPDGQLLPARRRSRHKILIEDHAFPSDHFAVESQIRQRGFDPATGRWSRWPPRPRGRDPRRRPTSWTPSPATATSLAIDPAARRPVLHGAGPADGRHRPESGHGVGAVVGFDLAHAAGNVPHRALHDWDVDFAAWVHLQVPQRRAPAGHRRLPSSTTVTWPIPRLPEVHRLGGGRQQGGPVRDGHHLRPDPHPSSRGSCRTRRSCSWRRLLASLEVFTDAGGMDGAPGQVRAVRSAYLDRLLAEVVGERIEAGQPEPELRPAGLPVRPPGDRSRPGRARRFHEALEAAGVACDWRYPDVIRVAPVPLYNSFVDHPPLRRDPGRSGVSAARRSTSLGRGRPGAGGRWGTGRAR